MRRIGEYANAINIKRNTEMKLQIPNLLADIQEERNLIYLAISHDLSVVEHVCARIAVIYLGQIVEYGTVEEVFSPPYYPSTEATLSAIPETEATEERIVLEGDVRDPSNVPSGCRFHPRCPHKIGKVCESEVPAEHTDGEGHQIQCHLMREGHADEVEWDDSPITR